MPDFEMKVSGLKETQRALYSYSQQLGDKVVLAALTTGARVIATQAKRNAPVATGRLKRAIFVKRSRIHHGKFGTGVIGVFIGVRRGRKRDDPKGAYYAGIVEHGYNTKGSGRLSGVGRRSLFNSRSGRKTNPGKTDVPGQKYMQRAFFSHRQHAVSTAVAAVHRGAEIVKRRLGLR